MDPNSPNHAGPSRSSSPLPLPLTRRPKRRKLILSDSETEDDDYSQPPSNYDPTPKRIRLTLTFNDDEFFKPVSGYVTSEYEGSPVKARRKKAREKEKDKEKEVKRKKVSRLEDLSSPSKPLRGGGRRPPPRRNKPNLPHHLNTRQTRSRNSLNSPQPSTETTLESISHESLLVKNEIHRLGLTLRDVTGDGNCLFRALADQLWGVQKRHAEVRRLVCDYLERERGEMGEFVEPFLVDGEGFDGYVNRMRQLKTFGSHIEIQAASRVLKRDVRVIMSTASFTTPWRTEGEKSRTFSKADVTPKSAYTKTKPPKHPEASPPLDHPPHPDVSSRLAATPNEEDENIKNSSRRHTRSQKPNPNPSHSPDLENPSPHPLYLALFSLAEHFQSPRSLPSHEGPANIPITHSIPHTGDQSESARRQRGELPLSPSIHKPTLTKQAQPRSRADVDIDILMNSLPTGHGIEQTYAEGILKRVKGNMDEAIEILLDEIHLYDDEVDEEVDGDEDGDGDGDGKSGVGSDGQYSAVEDLLLVEEGEGESLSSGSGGSGSRGEVIKVLIPGDEVEVEVGEEMVYDSGVVGGGYRLREAPGGEKEGGLVLTGEAGGLRVEIKEVEVGTGAKSRL